MRSVVRLVIVGGEFFEKCPDTFQVVIYTIRWE